MTARYPPEPWLLTGDLVVSAWLAPVPVPPNVAGWTLLTLGGRAVVGTVLVRYRPPGVLAYNELMVTALVRRGWRLAVTVLQIWVDSPESLLGGRELWAIPKQMASFAGDVRVVADGPLAEVTTGSGVRVPGRWRLRFPVVQSREGRAVITPVVAVGGLAPARHRWSLYGPLAWLAGRRPFVGVVLRDVRMAFGGPTRRVHDALKAAEITADGWKHAASGS